MAAESVGQIGLDLVVNKGSFEKQMSGIQGTAKKAAKTLAAAFTVKKIADFSAQCIELGSELQEVQNVVDVTFPKMKQQVNSFAQSAAASFGLSETMAKRFTGTFGAMAKAFGFGEKQAYEMSSALTGLAGDVASFYNISQDEAYTKLKSVFTGETESLKDLGVVMTQSALDAYALANGYGKATSAMSEMEKVALRYSFVQDQLSAASGDFLRTSDGWANQVRVLKLQFDSLKATIGQGLINVLTPVIKVINTIIGKLMSLANAFKSFTELITGGGSSGTASGIDNITQSAAGAESAVSGIGSAAKKSAKDIKGITTGIDELNIINPETGSGSDGAGGGYSAESFDMGALDTAALEQADSKYQGLINRMKELAGIVKKGFWAGFGDTAVFDSVKGSVDGIRRSLADIFTDTEVKAAANKFADSLAYSIGQKSGTMASVGETIADNLLGGIDLYLQEYASKIKQRLVAVFNIGADTSKIVGNFSESVADIFAVFRIPEAKQLTANLVSMFAEPLGEILEFVGKFGRDLLSLFLQPIIDNSDGIKKVLKELIAFIQPIVEVLASLIIGKFKSLNEAYDRFLAPMFKFLTEAVSLVLEAFLSLASSGDSLCERWSAAGTALSALWELMRSDVQVKVDSIRIGIDNAMGVVETNWKASWSSIKVYVSNIWNGIRTAISTIVRSIQTSIGTTLGNIKSNWESVWTSVKNSTVNIFNGIWSGIKGTINSIIGGVEKMANGVINGINSMIRALNGLSFDVPDWIPEIGGKRFGFSIPSISQISIPRLAQGGYVRANTPQLAMIGDNRRYGEIVAPEDKMQEMVNRAVSLVANQDNMSIQYLVLMVELLKKIVELIENLDLTVNIDIREIKNKLKDLENRSGFQVRVT